MTKRIVTAALATAMAVSPFAATPAFADGKASTRNIIIVTGAAAAIGITNYNHKKRAKRQEQEESARRQSSYKAYFYRKYGYYPTPRQTHDWYVRAYGVEPS
jgi:hypothetical protein